MRCWCVGIHPKTRCWCVGTDLVYFVMLHCWQVLVMLGYPSTWRMQLSPAKTAHKPVLVHRWFWLESTVEIDPRKDKREKTLASNLSWARERAAAVREEVRAEHKNITTWEKRGRRRSKSVQIWWLWTGHLQAGDWSLKRGWIGTKLGELVPHLEYFDLLSSFEDWMSRAPDWEGFCQFGSLQFQNRAILVNDLFGSSNGVRLRWNFASG